ncbi:MAG: hypothetical protein ACLU9S_02850 [Oscillospiraceae bacterium]
MRRDILAAAEQVGAQVYLPPLALCGDNAAMIGDPRAITEVPGWQSQGHDPESRCAAKLTILGETL